MEMWTEYQYITSDDFVQLLIVCEQIEDTGLQAVDDFEDEDSAEPAVEEQPKGREFLAKVTCVIYIYIFCLLRSSNKEAVYSCSYKT